MVNHLDSLSGYPKKHLYTSLTMLVLMLLISGLAFANQGSPITGYIFSESLREKPYEWISYDPGTDVITLIGDSEHCNFESPCTMDDIYNASQENGWNNTENYGTFFIIHSGLKIGDGVHETYFVSSFEQIKILKPWEVMPLASLQFGMYSEEEGGFGYGGSMIDVNVSHENQLDHYSAIKVNAGGRLAMYETKYKVYSSAENNIYMDNESSFDGWRFDVERVNKQKPPTVTGLQLTGMVTALTGTNIREAEQTTTLRLPENAVVKYDLKREDIIYECADTSLCQSLEGQE